MNVFTYLDLLARDSPRPVGQEDLDLGETLEGVEAVAVAPDRRRRG